MWLEETTEELLTWGIRCCSMQQRLECFPEACGNLGAEDFQLNRIPLTTPLLGTRVMRRPRGAPNALTFTFKDATKAAGEDNTEVLYREVAKKDLEVQTPERRPLPGTTGPLRPPRGDGARRLRSYVCFVADITSKTWPHPTCSVRRVSRSGR